MSAFKFACPVCGQHITCDAAAAGTPMDCPTCFRKLNVPQAPAAGSPGFVLTASEVQSRPSPGNGNRPAATQTQTPVVSTGSGRNSRSQAWFVALGVVGLAAIAVAVGLAIKKMRHRITVTNGAGPMIRALAPDLNAPAAEAPVSTATNWTLDLALATIPDTPVRGMVNGREFQLQRAVIQGGRLDLRQGSKSPPELGVSIHLFADRAEDLAGRTVVLEASRTNAPRVILRWQERPDQASTKDFRRGYAARLEFGSVSNNQLAGRIFLALPDEAKSYAAGNFRAEIRKPAPPRK